MKTANWLSDKKKNIVQIEHNYGFEWNQFVSSCSIQYTQGFVGTQHIFSLPRFLSTDEALVPLGEGKNMTSSSVAH